MTTSLGYVFLFETPTLKEPYSTNQSEITFAV